MEPAVAAAAVKEVGGGGSADLIGAVEAVVMSVTSQAG